jgi:hypothetical protein
VVALDDLVQHVGRETDALVDTVARQTADL